MDENDEFDSSMSIVKDMDLNDYFDFKRIREAAKFSSLSWEQKITCIEEIHIKFLQNFIALEEQLSQVFFSLTL